jgi:hypothetical protein
MSQDYIPRSEDERASWLSNFSEKGTTYAPLWDVPLDAFSALNTKTGKYIAALKVAKDPRHSQVDIAKKDEAEAEAIEEARKVYKHYIVGNDKVTNPQRVDCRLPVYDKIPTHVVLPYTYPALKELIQKIKACIEVHAVDSESGKKSKAAYVQGVEVAFWIGPNRVEHIRELLRSLFVMHLSFSIQLTDDDSTQYLSFAMRYENKRGEKGPWSPIYYVVIS